MLEPEEEGARVVEIASEAGAREVRVEEEVVGGRCG